APMVLGPQGPGRVGRCQAQKKSTALMAVFFFYIRFIYHSQERLMPCLWLKALQYSGCSLYSAAAGGHLRLEVYGNFLLPLCISDLYGKIRRSKFGFVLEKIMLNFSHKINRLSEVSCSAGTIYGEYKGFKQRKGSDLKKKRRR
ncbi:hypothetical protein, partial [Paenibacillus polymyxa]|uniref:hypothetical protein n=2 Tax=Paenibacillus polymyxa TaxID=1406 RepID=UPI001C70C6D6